MYARLAQIFGQGFVTRNGEEPNRDWVELFDQMTDEQLARGVKNAKEAKRNAKRGGLSFFPPDSDDFYVFCTTPRSDEPKALPNPYEISAGTAGSCRAYGIDPTGKTEDECWAAIYEAKQQ